MNPDRLAELEDERRFLLKSLADLEREHDAGDVDDGDYRELRDGYTVRAAAVLRAVDEGRAALPPKPPVNWTRRLLGGVIVVALTAIVWWALSSSTAQRLPGREMTGLDPRDEQQTLLSQARASQFTDPVAAAALYDLVLDDDPVHPEALAYGGWTKALSATSDDDLREAIDQLLLATEVDPDYPDPECFLGIVYGNLGQNDLAVPRLDECLAANPPADVRGLVEGLRAELAAGLESGEQTGELTGDG